MSPLLLLGAVTAEEIVAGVSALGGAGAIGYAAKWLWDRWRDHRKDARAERLQEHQRTRAERQEDENVMIAHLKDINDRIILDREASRKEVHDALGRIQLLENQRTLDAVKIATLEVTSRHQTERIRMLEKIMRDNKLNPPPWNDEPPTGSEVHAALQTRRAGDRGQK